MNNENFEINSNNSADAKDLNKSKKVHWRTALASCALMAIVNACIYIGVNYGDQIIKIFAHS